MILGLHGKMRAGKNECARRLVGFSPLPVVEVSFAAKLKESAAALFGVSVADLERWKNDENAIAEIGPCLDPAEGRGLTVREFLRRYGTEAHRDVFGQDFWLDAALPPGGVPTDVNYSHALYVVTDVRFPNEAQRVRDLGGMVVLVVGPEDETGTHASEQTLDPNMVNATIHNAARDDDFRSLDRQLQHLVVTAFGGSVAA